ncbi:nodulin 21 -like transporter family protein [Arabis alpina]|uniref:WAT1-related protein n=1 Tax=Arabis alpina TaxID=50452 RepID=A0A087GV19_ARAAL|nr:nodulin 21 -like transporter family protein [Arabis alpina]
MASLSPRPRDSVLLTAMLATETGNVAMNTLFKAATLKGLNSYTFLVYSYLIGFLLLLPCHFFSTRSRSLPPLSLSILCKIGLLGLIGSTYLITGFIGIEYSNPTLSSAISNINPAITFILAVIFSMEKVSFKERSSVAKVMGTIVSLIGALVVVLYHGPRVFTVSSPPSSQLRQLFPPLTSANSDWIIGGCLLAIKDTLVSVAFILQFYASKTYPLPKFSRKSLPRFRTFRFHVPVSDSMQHRYQAHIMNEYPAAFTVSFFYCLFASTFISMIGVVAEKNNPSIWTIQFDITLLCIVVGGVFNPGYYTIHLWAVRNKGPVYLAIFRPLSILIAVIMGAIFLDDFLYLGSVVGGILISLGFYTVMWGKAKEEKTQLLSLSEEALLF